MQVAMRVANSLCCGIPTQHNHEPRTTDETLKKMDERYDKMNVNEQPNVCYTLAMHAGVAGKTLTKNAEQEIARQTSGNANYNERYQQIMGITAGNARLHFNAADIPESGIINFRDRNNERLYHTAYIHRDPSGALSLMHNNGMALDRAMIANQAPDGAQHGGMVVYPLDQQRTANLQAFLDSGFSYHFSPASAINERVGQ